MSGFFVLAILWVPMGLFCLGITAKHMGYLRWSDLFLVLFGPVWLATPFWRDENGKRMWTGK